MRGDRRQLAFCACIRPGDSTWRDIVMHCLQVAKDTQFAGLSGVSNLLEFVAALLGKETPAAARASAWFEKRPQGGILADEVPLLQQALHHLEVRRCTCVSLVLV